LRSAAFLGLRWVGAIGGGYALAAQLAALTGALLSLGGMPPSDATTVALLSAYLIYAGLLLWAAWERSLARLWGVLVAGSLAAALAARGLS
jgi:hypothetical protein